MWEGDEGLRLSQNGKAGWVEGMPTRSMIAMPATRLVKMVISIMRWPWIWLFHMEDTLPELIISHGGDTTRYDYFRWTHNPIWLFQGGDNHSVIILFCSYVPPPPTLQKDSGWTWAGEVTPSVKPSNWTCNVRAGVKRRKFMKPKNTNQLCCWQHTRVENNKTNKAQVVTIMFPEPPPPTLGPATADSTALSPSSSKLTWECHGVTINS